MEERVARILGHASLQPTIFSDEDVAAQIRLEMEKKKKRAVEYGVFAYAQPVQPTQNINKGFLLNTIKGVDSHNRRQEIDACYRQRELDRKLEQDRRRNRSIERHRKRSRSRERESKRHDPTHSTSMNEREFWAARKAEKTQLIREQVAGRECTIENAPAYESSSEDDYSDSHAAKKAKAEMKSKKKSKKSKKSKKKHKKHKSDN
ncbi:unnamed protein product [Aphanomyces euteiches]